MNRLQVTQFIVCGLIGGLYPTGLTDWHFWANLGLVMLYGALNNIEGRR